MPLTFVTLRASELEISLLFRDMFDEMNVQHRFRIELLPALLTHQFAF